MTLDLTRIALQTRRDLQQQSNIELSSTAVSPVYLTLTRTTTLTVGGPGAIITWQSEDRNSGFTWSGSVITIPSSGYYLIDVAGNWSSTGAQTYGRIYVNGIMVERMTNHYLPAIAEFRVMGMRYFDANDNVEIQLLNAGGSRGLLVTAYGVTSNSPFLHIVKID